MRLILLKNSGILLIYLFLKDLLSTESDYYKKGEYLLYETDSQLGITVITDTTERSPTFSLFPFENVDENETNLSLCYLYMPGIKTSKDAWESAVMAESQGHLNGPI